ncbi:GDCCVxC domain-containing (seleno)protein [Thermosynechococcus sp. QKsg1]|uniref:GDCCVxC domain-containing (seleno)protein n=1 Tax=unclassified Thermosynechococcus TaxID=2622553 RepID=UPI00257533C6|nr:MULTISPECIES: GDCCVxC domain-containing (seleno)protein [unclassified Thermosynechococcus]WJI27537.1 hypothetical protein M0644_04895 [Thermosynechococcus sp. B1]WJI30069.1 hypothetical protein M0646_04900 [Thermosynechococcus sp. B3]WNC87656.1 GDCCVxC domain-containing (seleno)protein [Thermosynechococcus sp. QKsg1]
MSQPSVVFSSTLVCPHCHTKQAEWMPSDACVVLWECPQCHAHLKPKAGDCCVFCSYGTVPCPSRQLEHTGDR